MHLLSFAISGATASLAGALQAPWVQTATPDFYNGTVAQQPNGRMGTPGEVARCIVFLASPASS